MINKGNIVFLVLFDINSEINTKILILSIFFVKYDVTGPFCITSINI